jgi:hypothetical protein
MLYLIIFRDLNGENMKNQINIQKAKSIISVLFISSLLFFTIITSLHVNAAYPLQRSAQAMAYDSTSDRIIVYGGETKNTYDYWVFDTWAYDYNNNEWIQMNPTGIPYPSVGAVMVYDSDSDKMVAFGGAHAQYYTSNETWIYDYTTNTWYEASPNNVPRLRCGHAMAYDSESDVVIMFGGAVTANQNPYGDTVVYNDTWAYDLNTDTWTNMTPSVTPLGRGAACIVYDSESDRIILFGGYHLAGSPFLDPTGECYQKDTWSYDYNTNTWENVTSSTNPDPRVMHALAYDSESDRIIMFGGYTHLNTEGLQDETWAYDYNTQTWTQMNPTGGLERILHQMVYDSESDLVVLFGGAVATHRSVYFDETWVYDYNIDIWTLMPIPETDDTDIFFIPTLISLSIIAIVLVRRRSR